MDEEIVKLEGFIIFYKYENADTGYKIALFKIDDNLQERVITIVGYFPKFNKEDRLFVVGNFIKHPRYGMQLEVTEINVMLPTEEKMIVRFLSSSKFNKIGKSTASKIYKELGNDCISILINSPETYDILISKKIINSKQATSLQNGLSDYDYTSSSIQMLIKHGFSMKNIMKIESVYKDKIDVVLQANPYQIVIDIDGIGFKTIDKLALSLGMELTDKRRIKAAILYSLQNTCHSRGDTYISYLLLKRGLYQLVTVEDDFFDDCLNELIEEKYIILEDNRYYHYLLYKAEIDIANKLYPYLIRDIHVDFEDNLDDIIHEIEQEDGITYTIEQINSLKEALKHGLFIITGGPGTGKTTILDALIKIYKKGYRNELSISLLAPTGRASKRMSMLANHYACTIHRFLKWDLHSNTFVKNENNPVKTDIIIIDEFSMVDTILFASLLKGVTGVSQIILIGDDGQLPSVGAGNLLYDLLSIPHIPSLKLTKIFRQAKGSSIIKLAHDIRYNQLTDDYKFKDDIRFYNIKNTEISDRIISIIKVAINQGFDIDEIQVIIPVYAAIAGIDNMNQTIQDFVNPKSIDKPEIRVGHQLFRLYDRVLQLKNQPEDDIYNGDIGHIIDINKENETITVNFDGNIVEYNKNMYTNLTLAYAISVHKSQGSEFEIVIMGAFKEYGSMFNKKLIYTAVSRAKKLLIILGNLETFIKCSKAEDKTTRNTTLKLRILDLLNPNITN